MRLRYVVDSPAILRDSLLHIPRSWVNLEQVRYDLTKRNGAYWQAAQNGLSTDGIDPTIELFTETEDVISVPRHYRVPQHSWMVDPRLIHEVDMRFPRPPGFGRKSRITLRSESQQSAVEALLKNRNDKILALGCGKGKTVVALHAAAIGERFPMLVVVHTNALKGQWRERIAEHLGIPERKVGIIQGGTKSWEGSKISIAMLHTLVMHEHPPEFYRYWNLVVFDEAHRLGANFFAKAASMLPCERWGLSATVTRSDGMDQIFRLHLGKVAYEDLDQPLVPQVYFIHTGIKFDQAKFTHRRGRVNIARLTTRICEHEKRNDMLAGFLDRAYAAGRTSIVLGERLAQLHNLMEITSARDKALHIGQMDEDARREALNHRMVFATQHLAKEGLDKPSLDTLFITVPFGGEGRLQQSKGRIEREYAGKKDPKIYIFVDDVAIMQALARKMERYLRTAGCEIRHHKLGKKEGAVRG